MFLAPLHRAPSDPRTLQAFLFDYYPDQDNSGNTQSPEQPTLSLENGAKVLYAKVPASGIDAHVCPQGSCLELNYAFNQYAKVRWSRQSGVVVLLAFLSERHFKFEVSLLSNAVASLPLSAWRRATRPGPRIRR